MSDRRNYVTCISDSIIQETTTSVLRSSFSDFSRDTFPSLDFLESGIFRRQWSIPNTRLRPAARHRVGVAVSSTGVSNLCRLPRYFSTMIGLIHYEPDILERVPLRNRNVRSILRTLCWSLGTWFLSIRHSFCPTWGSVWI